MFTKHSPSEILRLNFEKKTVYLNYNNDVIHSRALECSAFETEYAAREF